MSELYFLENTTPSQMMGFVIKTQTKTVVIDGGTSGDGLQLAKLLQEEASTHVDAWFFTHPHADHTGAFAEICEKMPEITVDRLLYHFPSLEMIKAYETYTIGQEDMWQYFEEVVENRFRDIIHLVKQGEVFVFDDITIHALRVFNPEITTNLVNNSTTVYRIDSPDKKVLILGDLGVEGGKDTERICSPEELYADYTQLAHHGQSGVDKEFYQYIRPQRCLWAAPDWLWDNNNGGGIGSGPWRTLQTREWMQELGVIEHIVQKDGTVRIQL